ncbi:MAG: DUF4160 domain-containing protein [Fibrobacterota bacterium]
MPAISMFFGIVVYLYYKDDKKHHLPHFHAEYGEFEGIFLIETGEMIEGDLPNAKRLMVQAWIEIHKEELLADWKLAVHGEAPFKIEPLR